MSGANEEAAKRKLGIPSWRNLTKNKVLNLMTSMPENVTNLRLKIIEQFPAFKDLSKTNAAVAEEVHKATLAANEASQSQVYKASQDQRDALKADLARDDLTWEQRMDLHGLFDQNVQRVHEKDSENKNFLGWGMKAALTVVAFGGALGVAFVAGGRIIGGTEIDSEESQ